MRLLKCDYCLTTVMQDDDEEEIVMSCSRCGGSMTLMVGPERHGERGNWVKQTSVPPLSDKGTIQWRETIRRYREIRERRNREIRQRYFRGLLQMVVIAIATVTFGVWLLTQLLSK